MKQRECRPALASVIIPTHNRAEWLPACVESVRASGTSDVEIIVVDDGSTDATSRVVQDIGSDVRYIWQANAGPAAARNRGARKARGRYVAFLDSDDRWLPDAPRRLIEYMELNPELAVGFGDVLVGNSQDGYGSKFALPDHDEFWRLPHQDNRDGFLVPEIRPFFRCMVRCNQVHVSAAVVRRSAFEAVGGYDEALRGAADWDLWLRLAARFPFVFFRSATATYEKHVGNMSRDLDHMWGDFVAVLGKALRLEPNLTEGDRACLEARLAEVMYEWTYFAFDREELDVARRRSADYLKIHGADRRVLLYWCASWLPGTVVQKLRALKDWN
jgi:glycosyltransferase involved in cell wall biosynthesis